MRAAGDAVDRVLLIGVLLVLVVELLNSSVEAAIDRIGLDTHRLSKRAKDLGSAAVLVALVKLAVVGGDRRAGTRATRGVRAGVSGHREGRRRTVTHRLRAVMPV